MLGEPFLNKGMIYVNLAEEKERFTNSFKGYETSAQTSLRILIGTLLGPELLEEGIDLC